MKSFHVRHDFSPPAAREVLLLLRDRPASGNNELLRRAQEHGFEIGRRRSTDKVVSTHRDLGLVQRSSQGESQLALTDLGREVADLAMGDTLLFAELIHLRYWWLWPIVNREAAFGWAYRFVSNLLWDDAPTKVVPDRLVASVLSAAERAFGVAGASFSASSVLGVLHWLRALSPPCFTGDVFQRRLSCPAESAVLSIEGLYATRKRPLGLPLRLDGEARCQLSRATMTDQACLDDVLAEAEESLGLIRRSGDGGEFVVLRESAVPTLVSGHHKW